MRRGNAVVVAVVALAGGPAVASGQSGEWVRQQADAPRAWLGLTYDVEWLAGAERCESRVVVETVLQGAPADRAGLRPGDALLSVDGESLAGGLERLSTRLEVGEPVRLTVVRDGRRRDLVAVAGERPAQPPVMLYRESGDGFAASDAPVILLRADTVVARNLDGWTARQGGGYWLVQDGRTDFRRLATFSASELDRKVTDLMLCAQRTQSAAVRPAPLPPMPRVMALQERADSLREVLVRRAMSRAEPPQYRVTLRPTPAPPPPGIHASTFSVTEHLLAAERWVAGAEVVAMEPELAAYFRGTEDGLLVLRVAPGTPAARAGLEPGDVITGAGGRRADSVGELRELLATPDATPIELRIVRHGRARTITLGRY